MTKVICQQSLNLFSDSFWCCGYIGKAPYGCLKPMQPIVLYSGFLPATIKIEDYCNKKDFGNYLMIPDEFLQYKATTLIDKCLYYIHGCKLYMSCCNVLLRNLWNIQPWDRHFLVCSLSIYFLLDIYSAFQ